MFKQKFASLKPIRQISFDGFLNNPWTGKSNESPRLAAYNIAQHGERGGSATKGRIGAK